MREELWEELGRALDVPEQQLEKISKEEGTNFEKCKQCVLNVRTRHREKRRGKLLQVFSVFQAWLMESEEVTWERFVKALDTLEEVELAGRVREDYCKAENEQKIVSKQTQESGCIPPYKTVYKSLANLQIHFPCLSLCCRIPSFFLFPRTPP